MLANEFFLQFGSKFRVNSRSLWFHCLFSFWEDAQLVYVLKCGCHSGRQNKNYFHHFSSVTQSYPTLFDPMNCSTPGLPGASPTPGVHSNSGPSSQWCHLTISSSVIPFSSCLQSFPASGSFPVSQSVLIRWPNIGVSASASVLQMNIQNWFPLGLTGLISLQFKGLSRVLTNTTVQKHQFFGAQINI